MINPIASSLSGLQAASKKASVAANNIVNADSVGSLDPNSPNQAYAAQVTVDKSLGDGSGVETVTLKRDPPFVPNFEPDSPFANSDGMVNAPNVNVDEELLNLKKAEQSYQANAIAMRAGVQMQDTLAKALDHKS